MKVDIVINSMIQQVDRSMLTQAAPPLSFRTGEILQGRVMLTADDNLQIRLDNGALLNAIPNTDVLLSAGASVTLRVTGSAEGQFVMQLLDQYKATEASAAVPGTNLDEALLKGAIPDTPQGQAVQQAMERMNLPMRDETARQALDILAAFPDLEPEKAVFMAANQMPATQDEVNALNQLLDGKASTGGELAKLADILTRQAQNTETVQPAESFKGSPTMQTAVLPSEQQPTAAAQNTTSPAAPAAQNSAAPAQNPAAQAAQSPAASAAQGPAAQAVQSPVASAAQNPAAQAVQSPAASVAQRAAAPAAQSFTTPANQNPVDQAVRSVAAPSAQSSATPSGQSPTSAISQNQTMNNTPGFTSMPAAESEITIQARPFDPMSLVQVMSRLPAETDQTAAQTLISQTTTAPAPTITTRTATVLQHADDGKLQMQNLTYLALGADGVEQNSSIIAKLADANLAKDAASLVMDGMFLDDSEFSSQLQAFTSALPQDAAPQVKAFLQELTAGLKKSITGGETDLPGAQQAPKALAGIPRILQEITSLFVKLDSEKDPAASIAKAAATLQTRLEHLAASMDRNGAASPEATQQLNKIENHVRLLDDISQYAYQQIPVQVNDKNRTVDLYVLNRGRNGKKINPNSANILIALDTDNLGHLETLINVTNKSLRLRFGVENPTLVGYLSGFTAELSQAMQSIGYKLSDMRTQVTSKPVNPLTVAQAVEPGAESMAKLDIKL